MVVLAITLLMVHFVVRSINRPLMKTANQLGSAAAQFTALTRQLSKMVGEDKRTWHDKTPAAAPPRATTRASSKDASRTLELSAF